MLCLSGVGFSVLLCFLLLPFETGMDCGKKSLLPMSSRAKSFVLNWLTVTITKSNKSSNCHLSFVIFCSFMQKLKASAKDLGLMALIVGPSGSLMAFKNAFKHISEKRSICEAITFLSDS